MQQDEVFSAIITFMEAPDPEAPEAQKAIDQLAAAARQGLLQAAMTTIAQA